MNYLKKLLDLIKVLILIIFFTFFLTIFIDFFLGKKIMKKFDSFFAKSEFYEKLIRINHPIITIFRKDVNYRKYKSFDGLISFCTDNHGLEINVIQERKKGCFHR